MSVDRHVTLRMEERPLDLAIESLSFCIAAIAFKASQGEIVVVGEKTRPQSLNISSQSSVYPCHRSLSDPRRAYEEINSRVSYLYFWLTQVHVFQSCYLLNFR